MSVHCNDLAYAKLHFLCRIWAVYSGSLYDLTDYAWTLNLNQNTGPYEFLDDDLVDVFRQRAGQDVTTALNAVLNAMNTTYREQHMACLNTVFLAGEVDFRKTARCQVQNWLLIFFSALLMASIALKCLSSPF